MKTRSRQIKIGIIGCGAIGTRIAQGIHKDYKKYCRLNGLFDIDQLKVLQLSKNLRMTRIMRASVKDLIDHCDFVVEAVNADQTDRIIRQALAAKRSVLAMSVGKLLHAKNLFRLAQKNKCHLLIPSGAIAGIDAIKAANLSGIHSITLSTHKYSRSFQQNAYLKSKGLDMSCINEPTVLFDGDVGQAVEAFPQNINVAATIALAATSCPKLRVRIIASPTMINNSHEIELNGPFGKILTRTDNVVCPDNPKTSYLAVLSGLQTIKQYCQGVFIGT